MKDMIGAGIAAVQAVVAIVLIAIVSGCNAAESMDRVDAHELAIEGLRDRISRNQRKLLDGSFPAHLLEYLEDFEIPSDQAGLDLLVKEGPNALSSPVVLWASFFPNPRDGSRETSHIPPYTHGVAIEWMAFDSRVTGFFVVMNDGSTHEFRNVFNPEGEHMQSLGNVPGKYENVTFFEEETVGEMPTEGWVLWPAGLEDQAIVQRDVRGIGLILEDGTRSDAGPVGYRNFPPEDDLSYEAGSHESTEGN